MAAGFCNSNPYFNLRLGFIPEKSARIPFILRSFLLLILLLVGLSSSAQLFDQPDRIALVRRGIDHIYNMEPTRAYAVIDSVERVLPDHPVGPLMRSALLLWQSIPYVTADTTFEQFTSQLNEVIRLATRLDGGRQEDPEAIFFELAARGLLAEYFAESGAYMRAATEANKTYNLLKLGAKLIDEIPDFYLTTGVYNYFREKYPERYPVYKPFVWFFRSGDIELGLEQLHLGCEKALLTRVESHIYLSYIYLRYEYQPEKAIAFLGNLMADYPRNRYVKAKYLEALVSGGQGGSLDPQLMDDLIQDPLAYFKMAGYAFKGYAEEKNQKRPLKAKEYYLKSLTYDAESGDKGEFYISLAHIGLARIYRTEKQYDLAIKHGELALQYAETPEITREAENLLSSLGR